MSCCICWYSLQWKKNQWLEYNFLYIGSYDEWFYIKSWQKFANLFLLCKAPTKKRLSETCRKHTSLKLRELKTEKLLTEPAHNEKTCVASKDADQPVDTPSVAKALIIPS